MTLRDKQAAQVAVTDATDQSVVTDDIADLRPWLGNGWGSWSHAVSSTLMALKQGRERHSARIRAVPLQG